MYIELKIVINEKNLKMHFFPAIVLTLVQKMFQILLWKTEKYLQQRHVEVLHRQNVNYVYMHYSPYSP